MKKAFNFFLSALTLVTSLNVPTSVVAEEIPTATAGTENVQVKATQEPTQEAESTPSASTEPTASSETDKSTTEANKATEVLDIVDDSTSDDDIFTYSVEYAEDYSKATVKIFYTKEDDVYLDLGNADDFAELAETGKFAVNEEQTSDLVLAFDAYENGSYVFKAIAYSNEDDSEVASGEKTLEITDIGKEVSTPEPTEDPEEEFTFDSGSIVDCSVEDLVKYINSGKTLMFMIGNEESDETYQRIITAYASLQESVSGQTDTTFLKVTSGDDAQIKALTALTMNSDDITNIVAAYNDLVKDSTGHAVVGFVYNKYITEAVREADDTDEYTVEDQAVRNWSVKYNHSGDDAVEEAQTEAENDSGIMVASNNTSGNPSVEVGTEWKYKASGNNYQEFTAPESGTYYVELWGADGDSDTGSWTNSYINSQQPPTTTGIGGQAGTVKGYVHLDKGQTIYLSLGYRNGMNNHGTYGGGGIGWGQSRGYRSGGGGAGAIYLSKVSGNGELANYENYQDQILMVAGGGGGAEDFYTATWSGNGYYCSSNVCVNSRGGNGGKNPTSGTSTGPTASTSGYKFGVGQDYNSYENSSSGAGGAGLMGGISADGNHNILKGGTGAGGSSYINETYIKGGTYVDGTALGWDYDKTEKRWLTVWDDGQNAGAIIKMAALDEYTLTINYLDVNDDSVVAEQHVSTHAYGEAYSVTSPDVLGYTLAEKSLTDAVVDGTMPAHDVTINVYYDYPRLVVHYKEWGTEETLHDDYVERLQVGTDYSVDSPSIDGYEFYETEDKSTPVAGTKKEGEEEFTVYYVKRWEPTKHIIAVNGYAISEEQCEAGVELKVGDIVTYEIRYENRRNVARTETITDELPLNLRYVEGSATNSDTQVFTSTTKDNQDTLEWVITSEPTSEGSVTFNAEVIETDENLNTVINWDRNDPVLKYSVVKESDPKAGTTVSYGQEVVYNLIVKNTGEVTVHNLVVVDPIPENSEYSWVNHSYKGEYVEDGNYVKYQIDELLPGAVAKLQFKVKVTKQLKGTETDELVNVAYYQNFNPGTEIPSDKEIIEKGVPTNEIIHPLVGVQLDAVKSSNPVSGSSINPGSEVEYHVTIANTTPTYQVITGAQALDNPTTYESGTDFTYSYTVSDSGVYALSDIAVNVDDVDQVTISNVTRMHLNTDSIDSSIWNIVNGTTTTTFIPKDVATNGFPTKTQVVSLLESLSWTMDSLQIASGSGNVVSADNEHDGEMNNAVPDGYLVKIFSASVSAESSTNKTAHVDFGTVSSDYTTNPTYFDFGSYVDMSGEKAHVYTYAGNDGNYKNVKVHLVAYKTSADEELITVGMAKAYEEKYGDTSDMSSATTNIHITDEIPSYMTYVEGSAYLKRNGVEEQLISTGANFDVRYTGNGGYYYLDNIAFNNVSRFNRIEITYPTSLTVDGGNNGSLVKEGITDMDSAITYLKSLKFYGNATTATGSITVKLRYYSKEVEASFSTQFWQNGGWYSEGNITVIADGYYQLEAAGAQGGSGWGSSAYGGAGGYVKGTIYLTAGTKLYYLGGNRGFNNMGGKKFDDRIYNGGGYNTSEAASAGGAAYWALTDRGALANYNNYRSEVLLVAGGGGAGQGAGAGGASNAGGNSFGQGANASSNPGGGGWTGGSAGRGGTNYIKEGLINTESKAGVNSNPRTNDNGYNAAAAYGRITYMGTDVNNLVAQTAYKYNIVDETNATGTTTIPQSTGTFGTCAYKVIDGKPSIECVANDIEAGKNVELVFKATVDANVPNSVASVENTAYYDSSFDKYTELPGTKGETNTNTVIHYLTGNQPVISAVKSSDPVTGTVIRRGQDITYSIQLTNTGTSTAKYVHVRDYIPEFSSYKANTITNGGVYVSEGNYVEWVVENIAPGESKTVQFTVTSSRNMKTTDRIKNTALYEIKDTNPGEPGTIDDDPSNKTNETDHGTTEQAVDPNFEITATKSANPSSGDYVKRSSEIEYVISVTNTIKSDAAMDYILVGDAIPEGTTFKEFVNYTAAKESPNIDVRTYYSEEENTAKWIVENLAKGDTVELRFIVTVDKECELTEITNIAKFKKLSHFIDEDQTIIDENNFSSPDTLDFDKDLLDTNTNVTTHYLWQPNVTVVKSSDPETGTVVPRGGKITYTLSVTNTGDDVANYVNIEDFIPKNTTYVTTSARTEVDTDKAGTSSENGTVKSVQYVLYDLAVGETRTVSFSVTVNNDAQSGVFIDNVAYYKNHETEHGKPGTDTFVNPDVETNKTRHTVELSDDIILTGGSGWKYLPFIGGGVLVLVVIIVLIASKKKKDDSEDEANSSFSDEKE